MPKSYEDLEEVLRGLNEKLEVEETLKELLYYRIDMMEKIIIKEVIKNRKLQREVRKKEEKFNIILQKLIFKVKGLRLENKVLNNINEELLEDNRLSRKKLENKEGEIRDLRKFLRYSKLSNRGFLIEEKAEILELLKGIESLMKDILLVDNKNKRKLLVSKIEYRLGRYEDFFYKNNFEIDHDILNLLYGVKQILNRWRTHSKESHTKEGVQEDVSRMEILLQGLKYISLYNSFKKCNRELLAEEDLFHQLKLKGKLKKGYMFKRFQYELKILCEHEYYPFNEKLILRRIFPGRIYTFPTFFNNIYYNFSLLKTYNMYSFLYIYGSVDNRTIKVGVSKNNLANRYYSAKQDYDSKFSEQDFKEIKVINTPNAFNLEVYLKRKYRKYRHPLFCSTEWFMIPKDGIKYFTENKYSKDKSFVEILNYTLHT
ncbi:hypothetical protein A3863_10330 [Priestia endophytica]|uniref:GIY-YIG nuclease family protein n=1 Tax=Priestia endophytica TaxID=135735 RepID=UPI000DCA7AE4|nr:GIY-YIG nuclease family protein [Priestia endophytica]RAS89608.1 hypothetical protein A3863_10330 [Priestia endophytica]